MKKSTLVFLSCFLLFATACGNDEANVQKESEVTTEITETEQETTITETEAITETKATEATEKDMEITMDNIAEVFSLEYPTENYENYNPLFLYCLYDKPSEMDLRTVLYHGIGEEYNYNVNEMSEEEILGAGLSIEGVKSVGAVKIPKDKLNEYLVKKTGLAIDEFENTDMKFKYNEQYDAYYGYKATDTILQPLEFISVEMNGDVYTAVYTTINYTDEITCQVEFKINDGVLQFISNKQL